MSIEDMNDAEKLDYEIHKYSSYSTSYLPENIREDRPASQTSRWSSNTNTPPQYLMLRLHRPSVVSCIKFGKHEKTHVCNLKKFKIFGGLEEDNLVLLFEGGMRNDSIPEVFKLRYLTDTGELLPIMYVKILPLLSWGPSFNFSIWYVELLGKDEPVFVRSSLHKYNMLRELEIVRLCLKHFRQQGYESAFAALQQQTNVHLEHPVMSELHRTLVDDGDFDKAEQFIEQFIDEGHFDGYISVQDYKAIWTQQPIDDDETRPGMRGGHQLIVDSAAGFMYLFGGWDGFEDLSDLWQYDIQANVWTLIHAQAEKHGGPGPRSCHKMLFDATNSQIFALGRYLDSGSRLKENLVSDFHLFNTKTCTWLQICDDTSQVGGPQLIFDHQMCIDSAKDTIYVFGGRILTPRNIEDLSTDMQYSGLFSYHIGTNTWTEILVDCGHPTASNPDVLSIKSRVTHSMLFHNRNRKLYIFGGQRNKEYTTEFVSFDVDTQELKVLNTENSSVECGKMPQSGFTQRATIDCERDEIYVLSSLSKEKERRDLNLNSFWMYSLKTSVWSCIYRSDHSTELCFSKANTCAEPCPRYAHQLVYDAVRKVHYLFGGNPGKNTTPQLRLDDFWVLLLKKPSRSQVLQKCQYLVRRVEYEEIASFNPLKALRYLQTKLSDSINHEDPVQLKQFHRLASLLFKGNGEPMLTPKQEKLAAVDMGQSSTCDASTSKMETDSDTDYSHSSTDTASTSTDVKPDSTAPSASMVKIEKTDEPQNGIKTRRCLLYNQIVQMLPDNMVQPKGNLSDFVLV